MLILWRLARWMLIFTRRIHLCLYKRLFIPLKRRWLFIVHVKFKVSESQLLAGDKHNECLSQWEAGLLCDASQASIKTTECSVLERNNASAIHQEMCLGRAEESGAGFSEDRSRELRVIWQGDVHLTNEMNRELYASCAQLVMLVRVMCFSAGIGPVLLWRIHYSSWHPWDAGVFSWDTAVMQLPGVSALE